METTLRKHRFALTPCAGREPVCPRSHKAYAIDDVLDVRRSSARRVGGDGICYTVRIGTRSTYLYYEDPRWFVEEIVADDIPA